MRIKNPDTKYDLEKYLDDRKSDTEKTPRAPSGFMKKQEEKKAREKDVAKPHTPPLRQNRRSGRQPSPRQ